MVDYLQWTIGGGFAAEQMSLGCINHIAFRVKSNYSAERIVADEFRMRPAGLLHAGWPARIQSIECFQWEGAVTFINTSDDDHRLERSGCLGRFMGPFPRYDEGNTWISEPGWIWPAMLIWNSAGMEGEFLNRPAGWLVDEGVYKHLTTAHLRTQEAVGLANVHVSSAVLWWPSIAWVICTRVGSVLRRFAAATLQPILNGWPVIEPKERKMRLICFRLAAECSSTTQSSPLFVLGLYSPNSRVGYQLDKKKKRLPRNRRWKSWCDPHTTRWPMWVFIHRLASVIRQRVCFTVKRINCHGW